MTDKSHLLGFGYAPGNYWFVCQDCGDKHAVGDKRATRCEACAETLYSQVTSVEAVADKHRAMTTVPEEAVKRRIADALEYVWSALDCDVDHIESIIAHMQGNGLYVIEGQNYRRMAEAVQQASAYLALTQPNCAEKIISDLDAALKPEVGIPATELSTASKMEVVGDLQELLERLDAGLEYEGWMETDGAPVELFDIEAAQDLFADAAVAIRALSSPDHADADHAQARDVLARFRDYVIEGITAGTIMRGGEHHNPIWQEVASVLHADAGKVEGDGCPSVKGVIPTKFGESICFCGIDGARLILVSVCGNSGLVPIKYLLPHQLYVHDVQKLSEQGEVLVCAVPVYDQQINVTSALPSAPSQEVAGS